MTEQDIAVLLRRYKDGGLSEEEAVQAMRSASFEDMGFAEVDHSREQRQGFPEVIYAEGKTQEQVLAILQSLAAHGKGNLMATRASREKYDFVKAAMPDVEYDEAARIIYVDRDMSVERDPEHRVLILTAGTSDIPVAEEARLTAYLWGNTVDTCYDCGVAGIHQIGRASCRERVSSPV